MSEEIRSTEAGAASGGAPANTVVWRRGAPEGRRDGRSGRASCGPRTSRSSPRSAATATRCTTTRPRRARPGSAEIVVQGGVTSAILNAVVAEDLPGPGTVFLHVDWRFTAPVRPGDTITGAVEVLEVRHDKPITKLATSVRRQDGVVVLEGTAACYTMDVGL